MGLNVKYHIVEYEEDSIVKGYQIDIKQKITQVTLKILQNLEMENIFGKKYNSKITVNQIIEKMQQIANKNGPYSTIYNNCQSVAKEVTEQLLFKEISQCEQENGKSKLHSALLVVTQFGIFGQYFRYYIVEILNDGKLHCQQMNMKQIPSSLSNMSLFEMNNVCGKQSQKLMSIILSRKLQTLLIQQNKVKAYSILIVNQ
ncbi:unnamed protein product [Paramecium primaurelia]|uniref:Uncharacterized protein n=1 Tax=Paramecium primaurelia TaxID=5886 RepID=A0A8S1LNT3_PARPR|nr:unnamed protein product [Paramecium primaurelia]